MLSIEQYAEYWWNEVCKRVKMAVVYMDEEAVETLHWTGGLQRLERAGVRAVKDLRRSRGRESDSGGDVGDVKKAVFIVSKPVVGVTADAIREVIVEEGHFEYCSIITNASEMVHKAAIEMDDYNFTELEDRLLEWMGDPNLTAEVFYYPIHWACLSPEVFVTPTFNDVFPLGVDDASTKAKTANEEELLRTRTLTPQWGTRVAHLVTAFHSLFQMLNAREDIFSIGNFSRLLGDQLQSHPASRNRRKTAANKVSLLLIDRGLDLVGPMAPNPDNLLDSVRASLPPLPGHVNDVSVDMTPLFGLPSDKTALSEFPPGCLANATESSGHDNLLSQMIMSNEKEVVQELHSKLRQIVHDESLSDEDETTIESLSKHLQAVKNQDDLILQHIDLIQKARAVSLIRKSSVGDAVGRFIKLATNKPQEMREYLVHLTKCLRSRRERGLTVEDIILVTANVYALLPPDEEFYPEDEDRLQSALSEAIIKERKSLGPLLSSMTDSEEIDEIESFQMVKQIFTRLNSLRKARRNSSDTHLLVAKGKYHGFLDQLMEHIFADDRHDVPDLYHHTGQGLGGLIKSGIGLFGVSVSKMHPRENPNLMVFVVGGITAGEVRRVRTLVEERSACHFSVGGTKLLSPREALHSLLSAEKLYFNPNVH